MTKQQAAEARARCAAATPGPWHWHNFGEKCTSLLMFTVYKAGDPESAEVPPPGAIEFGRYDEKSGDFVEVWERDEDILDERGNQEDFDFAARARTDLPAALEMLERAMSQLQAFIDRDHADGDCGYLYGQDGLECTDCGAVGRTKEAIQHEVGCSQVIHDASHVLLREWDGKP